MKSSVNRPSKSAYLEQVDPDIRREILRQAPPEYLAEKLLRRREQNAAAARRFRQRHGSGGRGGVPANVRPFVGVDGEGAGTDALGRQNFLLLRAGDRELFRDNRPLRTDECLEHILALPYNAIYVGYFFTYDATMILRDLSPERIARLFQQNEQYNPARHEVAVENKTQTSSYVWWGEYALEFRPRQYFRVARLDRRNLTVVENSSRTINEVGGFFQKSFVEAITNWDVGTPELRAAIAEQKERRSEFTEITQVERDYCASECDLLAQMMEKFRDVCKESDIVPSVWRGAGALAARLHTTHKTPKRKDSVRPASFERMCADAYYGGRFEITAVGRIPGPIYEYDIHSAYPAAMLKLPCPVHTKWEKFNGAPPLPASAFVASIHFKHSQSATICGFPIRQKGKLYWPQEGNGIYWSPEIIAGIRAGAEVSYDVGYCAQITCSCSPFAWVSPLYEKRKEIGSSTRGYPIKLGLNALYGKLAQRQGSAPWSDYLLSGLITAYTRATLQEACNHDPNAIVYLATDAVFSRRPLPLGIGDGLGQWEEKIRDGLFIVQPGVYWSPGTENLPKTRGIPRSKIIQHRASFEFMWKSFCLRKGQGDMPLVSLPITNFIGHRLALARGKPELAGSWITADRRISFDWSNKRKPAGRIDGEQMLTLPYDGRPDLVSESFDPRMLSEFGEDLLVNEAADDYYPWGNTDE